MWWKSLLLAGVCAGTLQSADPAPDWIATLHARRAVWNDPALAELNLGVRVRDGVALLFGPVLSSQQAAEAVARVRLAPGVNDVIDELYILPANDLLRKKFAKPARPLDPPTTPVVRPRIVTPMDEIDAVRQSAPRFDRLRVVYREGVVTVIGPADLAAEFADRVRSLPGVREVRRGAEAHPAGAERRP